MKIGVLTSSRADFGIYLPLLLKLKEDSFFDIEVIAFGTHLSHNHGRTIVEIEKYQLGVIHEISTLPESDSPLDISKSIGNTTKIFSEFWDNFEYDLVFCLGDRYEMFAAVSAGLPFGVKFAHIHAGETTLGAIDNAYRHAISLFSVVLFVTTESYKKRAEEVVENSIPVINVGALSIDNLSNNKFLTNEEFQSKFDIDLNKPTILSTFHPETVSFEKNEQYIQELIGAFDELKNKYQLVITMPNTDTMGQMIRDKLLLFGKENSEVKIVESFGMLGYLSCMKQCAFMLGNTSSGFVEASYFPTFVINVGERQRGRIETKNIFTVPVSKDEILKKVTEIENKRVPHNENVYGIGEAAEKIIDYIKRLN